VKVYNDVAQFFARTKVSPPVWPGEVIIDDAWENFRFAGGIRDKNIVASPINPLELAGGYLYARPAPGILQAGRSDGEGRVQVAKSSRGKEFS
jgi:hypothetical protein